MNRLSLSRLLEQVAKGAITSDAALDAISESFSAPLPFAQLDLGRDQRTGTPEVVYGAGKTADQIAVLLKTLHERGIMAMATRVDAAKAAAVKEALSGLPLVHHPVPQMLELGVRPQGTGRIAVVCAGTSDLPVAEEAALVAECLGNRVERIVDVGIAGLHRVLSRIESLRLAKVVIVVAGMDGALPAVVAGLVRAPVIGVPTSVGYGAAFQGLAPMLTMLNACAPGVGVVNIDNGFGAAMLAHRINQGA